VRLRSAPSLDADIVTTIEGQRGSRITVLSPPDNGWYEITIGGDTGWVFGAFVTPADGGYTTIQNRSGFGVVLSLYTSGGTFAGNNPTAGAALAIETDGRYWEVLLPDGSTRFVDSRDVQLA